MLTGPRPLEKQILYDKIRFNPSANGSHPWSNHCVIPRGGSNNKDCPFTVKLFESTPNDGQGGLRKRNWDVKSARIEQYQAISFHSIPFH
jgi:hypothetical protein